jgi:hypothetical protein
MRFKGHLAGTAWVKLFTAALLLVQSYAWGECHFGARGEGDVHYHQYRSGFACLFS